MAIGKKRGGSALGIGATGDAKRNARRQAAIALAQKAASENQAGNRQLETARASASASLISAHAPSRLGERQAHERSMQEARFGEAAKQRDWQGTQSALDRAWRSSEAALGREWQGEQADRTRQFQHEETELGRRYSADQAQRDRDLRERMNNAGLQNQFLINAANQASADRRAREQLASAERIQALRNEGIAGKAAADSDYKLRLQALKNEGAVAKENASGAVKLALGEQKGMYGMGRDAAKYAHELELRGIDNEEWRRRQEFTDRIRSEQEERAEGRRRFAEDEKLVNAGTHEWGYTPQQQQTIDELWQTYDDALESGEADEDDLKEIEAQIQEKIAAIPKRAIRRTDAKAQFSENTFTDDAGRVFTRDGKLQFDPEANAAKREDALMRRADSYELSLRKPYTVTEQTGVDMSGNPVYQKRTMMRSEEEIAAMMRQKFPSLYPAQEPAPEAGAGGDAQTELYADLRQGFTDPNSQTELFDRFIAEETKAGSTTEQALESFGATLAELGVEEGSGQYNALMAQFRARLGDQLDGRGAAGAQSFDINAPVSSPADARKKWKSRRD